MIDFLIMLVVSVKAQSMFLSPSAWTAGRGYQAEFDTSAVELPTFDSGFTLEFWVNKIWSSEYDVSLIEDAIGKIAVQEGTPKPKPSSSIQIEESLAIFSLGETFWHHIAIVHNPSSASSFCYVNATSPISYDGRTYDFSQFKLGDRDRKLQSLFANINLWSKPRTQQSIMDFLYFYQDEPTEGLVMSYSLIEGSGNTVYDSVTNSNVIFPSEKIWRSAQALNISSSTYYKSVDTISLNCQEGCSKCVSQSHCLKCMLGHITFPRDYDSNGAVDCVAPYQQDISPKEIISEGDELFSFSASAYTVEYWFRSHTREGILVSRIDVGRVIITSNGDLRVYYQGMSYAAIYLIRPVVYNWVHISLNFETDAQVIFFNGVLSYSGTSSEFLLPNKIFIEGNVREFKIFSYKKANSDSYSGDYHRSELGGSLPDYYYPLNEMKAPYISRGKKGTDQTTSRFVPYFANSTDLPTVCYGSQSSSSTEFGNEKFCVDLSANIALSLATYALNLETSFVSCAALEAEPSAIEFWYKADLSSIASNSVLADFGELKFKRGTSGTIFSLGGVEVSAGSSTSFWKHYHISFQKGVALITRDYTASTCQVTASLNGVTTDPCPSKFEFAIQPNAFVRFVRWWEKEISKESSVLCSTALPFTSFVGLSLYMLRLSYPLNEATTDKVMDTSGNFNVTTIDSSVWVSEDTSSFIQRRRFGYVCTSSGCNTKTNLYGGVLASSTAYFLCSVANSQPTSTTECENRSPRKYPIITQERSLYVTSTTSNFNFDFEISFLLLNFKEDKGISFQLFSGLGLVLIINKNPFPTLVIKPIRVNDPTNIIPLQLYRWYTLRIEMYQSIKKYRFYLNGVQLNLKADLGIIQLTDITISGRNFLLGDIKVYAAMEPLQDRRRVFWDRNYSDIKSFFNGFSYVFVYSNFGFDLNYVTSSVTSSDKLTLQPNDDTMFSDYLSYSPTVPENDRYSSCAMNEYRVLSNGYKYACKVCASNCGACMGSLCVACSSGYYLNPTSPSESTCVTSCTSSISTPVPICQNYSCAKNCEYCYGTAKDQCLGYSTNYSFYDGVGYMQQKFFDLNKSTTEASISLSLTEFTLQLWLKEYDSSTRYSAIKTNNLAIQTNASGLFVTDGASTDYFNCPIISGGLFTFISVSGSSTGLKAFVLGSQRVMTACTEVSAYSHSSLTSVTLGSSTQEVDYNVIYSLRVLKVSLDAFQSALKNIFEATALSVQTPSSWTEILYPLNEGISTTTTVTDCKL